jgi:hypothetical protein
MILLVLLEWRQFSDKKRDGSTKKRSPKIIKTAKQNLTDSDFDVISKWEKTIMDVQAKGTLQCISKATA